VAVEADFLVVKEGSRKNTAQNITCQEIFCLVSFIKFIDRIG
jgi:hypothetical protein